MTNIIDDPWSVDKVQLRISICSLSVNINAINNWSYIHPTKVLTLCLQNMRLVTTSDLIDRNEFPIKVQNRSSLRISYSSTLWDWTRFGMLFHSAMTLSVMWTVEVKNEVIVGTRCFTWFYPSHISNPFVFIPLLCRLLFRVIKGY